MLFRAKSDSPEGGLRPPAGDAPPPLISSFFRRKQLPWHAAWTNLYFCTIMGIPMQLGVGIYFISYHQELTDRVPTTERFNNEPRAKCSSNMLSVPPPKVSAFYQ